MLFQIAVHLLKDGYPIFFRALSNFALVSRRSAELMEEISLRVHRMHKPCTTNSIWLWTNLQSFVNEQVRGGRDARLAVSAGLDRLLKPGMHLVPRGRDAGHHLVCQARRTAALLEALASGKVISIDLHGRSRDDDVSKELIQAIRKADSLQHLRIRLCVDADEEVEEESRKMRELIDSVRRAGEDKFSVTFVVGATYPGNVQL
jgi:hypothetical protein